MSFITTLISDLRDKRLWPVAAALAAALVAVPVLLSKSSSAYPIAQTPGAAVAPKATALPAISVQSTPSHGRLPGRGRDPFSQPIQRSTTTSTSRSSSSGSGSKAGSSTSKSSSGGSSSSTTTTSTQTTSTTTTTNTTTTSAPPPPPPGLSDTQSYQVAFAITNPSGGFNSVDSLQRLSVLPNARTPLLVELGVLQGGHRVVFAVQPDAFVSGPGVCAPGPLDCEIMTLAPDQVEWLYERTSSGSASMGLFSVTGIKAVNHASAAAAAASRRAESAAGRRVLAGSTLPVLSLFPYQPGIGAVVDERNLSIGGGS